MDDSYVLKVAATKNKSWRSRDGTIQSNTYYGMHLCNINWDHHEAIYSMYAMAADCKVLQNNTTIWEFV